MIKYQISYHIIMQHGARGFGDGMWVNDGPITSQDIPAIRQQLSESNAGAGIVILNIFELVPDRR